MIYTVTFNPSLDYIVKVDDFKTGQVNRTASERLFPGGKGINVSIVLKNLGFDNVALGFIAGFTGREIEKSGTLDAALLLLKSTTVCLGSTSSSNPRRRVRSMGVGLRFLRRLLKSSLVSWTG